MTRPIFHEKTALVWLWLSAIVVALDQLTKWYVASNFALFEILPVGPILDVTRIHNEGAAFGLLAEAGGWQRWFFLMLAIAISIAIIAWLRSLPAHGSSWLAIGLALILGGAIGNAYDRFAEGHVIDFLHFHLGEAFFPAFNAADIAITTGAVMLIIDALLSSRRNRAATR